MVSAARKLVRYRPAVCETKTTGYCVRMSVMGAYVERTLHKAAGIHLAPVTADVVSQKWISIEYVQSRASVKAGVFLKRST